MDFRTDNCEVGSRVCCPDGIAEAILDTGGNKGRNNLKYRSDCADDQFLAVLPVAPPLGSTYPPSFLIDVANEVFEFDGQEIVFDNCVNQLSVKAPGGI